MYRSLLLATLFFLIGVEGAAQLGKNFLPQLKEILEVTYPNLKGEFVDADENGFSSYKSKKALDGFNIEVFYDEVEYYGYFEANIPANKKNEALFESIRKEITVLNKEGYTIRDETTDALLKSASIKKRIFIYKEGELLMRLRLYSNNRIYLEREFELL